MFTIYYYYCYCYFLFFFKQRISILEDGASGEKVGDIEKVFVKNLFTI